MQINIYGIGILVILYALIFMGYLGAIRQRDTAVDLLLKYDKVINEGQAIMFVRENTNHGLSNGTLGMFVSRFRPDITVFCFAKIFTITQRSDNQTLIKSLKFDQNSEGMVSIDLATLELCCWFVNSKGNFVFDRFEREQVDTTSKHSGCSGEK